MFPFPPKPSAYNATDMSLPITPLKPSLSLSTFPAESRGNEQWQAKIQRAEDREDTERKREQARRNRGDKVTRRAFGANAGGAWERWEEAGEESGEEDDDDDGVVGAISMPGRP